MLNCEVNSGQSCSEVAILAETPTPTLNLPWAASFNVTGDCSEEVSAGEVVTSCRACTNETDPQRSAKQSKQTSRRIDRFMVRTQLNKSRKWRDYAGQRVKLSE